MVELDLNDDEKEILIAVLQNYLSDLRYEIGDTDRKEFRDELKEREVVLNKVLTSLRGSAKS